MTNQFKYLGIILFLNLKSMFDLNYKVKLKQIEQTLSNHNWVHFVHRL